MFCANFISLKENNMGEFLDFLKSIASKQVIFTIFLCVISLLVAKIIMVLFDKVLKKSKIDPLIYKILRIAVKAFLLFTVIIIVLSSLGISVSSFIAALSVVGVALSLAVQDFLSNVFGGLQIISTRPFKIGDYVEAGGEGGTVREVGLFYTKLDTPDKKLIQIPNSKIANDSIVNYSSATKRRIEFLICVSYDDDSDKVRSILLDLITKHPLTLDEEGMKPAVHVKEFRDNDICYTARVWCDNKDYWTVYFDVMDAMKATLESNGISFSYPHMNVHMIKE